MKLAELAERLGAEGHAAAETEITGLAGLREAGPADLSFLTQAGYEGLLTRTRAGAVLVPADWAGESPAALLRVQNPDLAFARAARLLGPPESLPPPGIHERAWVDPRATVAASAAVGPGCVIEAGACIGEQVVLDANCYIGRDAQIGNGCRLYPQVTVRERCLLGRHVIVHCGAVIGSDGFGYVRLPSGWEKIPQIGIVEIGDEAEIGANTTIDRARFGKTVIGPGVKLDNLVQVAHNVSIGPNGALAAQVGIAGSTRIGANVQMGGQAGAAGHLELGDGVIVGGKAGVTKNIPAGTFVSGFPALPHQQARKLHAHQMRLPELREQLRQLTRRLDELDARLEQCRTRDG